jgi:hypothetical protein
MTAVVPAFRDGANALRSNPVLLFAGLLLAAGSQLQHVGEAVESPPLEVGVSLAWLLVFPFVLGGFLGLARTALEGTATSLGEFVSAGRTYYGRILLGTVAFVLLVVVTLFVLGALGFVFGVVGMLAFAAMDETAAFAMVLATGIGWVLLLLVVVLFVQFYDVAIVVEDAGVTDAFRRSVRLVRSNLTSVIGFSLVWVVLLNLFVVPEYAVELLFAETAPQVPADAAPVMPLDTAWETPVDAALEMPVDILPAIPVDIGIEIPAAVALPVAIAISAIGCTYFYTVYTAYYLRLIADESDEPRAPDESAPA